MTLFKLGRRPIAIIDAFGILTDEKIAGILN